MSSEEPTLENTPVEGIGRPVMLLSGPRGVGKSTVCLGVAERLGQAGLTAAGIITQVQETRRFLLDVVSGNRRLLAAEGESLEGPGWGRYTFSQAGLDWGNHVVCEAIASGAELILLDEIGPLELVSGLGLLPALQAVLERAPAGLLVVRPALLDALRAMAGDRAVVRWHVSLENRDGLPDRIASWLLDRRWAVV